MIRSILESPSGDIRVIEVMKVSRGIGEAADEVLIYGFNKNLHPNQYKSLLFKLAHEGIVLDEEGNYNKEKRANNGYQKEELKG